MWRPLFLYSVGWRAWPQPRPSHPCHLLPSLCPLEWSLSTASGLCEWPMSMEGQIPPGEPSLLPDLLTGRMQRCQGKRSFRDSVQTRKHARIELKGRRSDCQQKLSLWGSLHSHNLLTAAWSAWRGALSKPSCRDGTGGSGMSYGSEVLLLLSQAVSSRGLALGARGGHGQDPGGLGQREPNST